MEKEEIEGDCEPLGGRMLRDSVSWRRWRLSGGEKESE